MIILCEMLENVGQLNTMVTCVSSFKGHSMNINRSWNSSVGIVMGYVLDG
jgi:hypothetical protein